MEYFRTAAQTGDAESQHNASMWFALAVEDGYWDSLHSKEAVARQMTPAAIAAGEKLITEWKSGRSAVRR